MRRVGFLLWLAAFAVGPLSERVLFRWHDAARWVPDLAVGWTFLVCGLVVLMKRRPFGSGLLLAVTGLAWFMANIAAGATAPLGWLAAATLFLHRGFFVHLVFGYPGGRARSRLTRGGVLVGYVSAIWSPIWQDTVSTVVAAAILVSVCAGESLRAVGADRRARRLALSAAMLFGFVLVGEAIARSTLASVSNEVLLAFYEATLVVIAIGLTVGLLTQTWGRVAVTDLVVELAGPRSIALRDELAGALGDPTLQVGYWDPHRVGFVDAQGRPLHLDEFGSGRSTTRIERDGQPMAVLVHDPAVLGDPGLIEAVALATTLAASNARLQAELRTRLAEVSASRRRILHSGDEERGRLERRLHRGAEHRLDELADLLRTARLSAAGTGTIEHISRSEIQLARTQEDLGRLARGIHPRDLSEHGLASALISLTEGFPLHVELAFAGSEISTDLDACAYFICSEALSNIAKYANASTVWISVTCGRSAITVEVRDDGDGGAEPGQGTGLRGLADRVETLDGDFSVQSPPGRGTRLVAVIPQPSSSA